MARAVWKLFRNSPAPTKATTARATSEVTSSPRKRCDGAPEVPVRPPSLSISLILARAASRAGASPARMETRNASAVVKARTWASSGGCNMAGLATPGRSQRSAPPSEPANIKPHTEPAIAISSVSVRSCRVSRAGGASQQQIRQVRANNQQHHATGAHEDGNRRQEDGLRAEVRLPDWQDRGTN